MMLNLQRLAVGLAVVSACTLAMAQQSDAVRISLNIHKLFVLNQLNALHLTSKQLKPIFRAVEHGHDTAAQYRRDEQDAMEANDPIVLEAIKAAENGDRLTTREPKEAIRQTIDEIVAKHTQMEAEETKRMTAAAYKILTEDQIRAAVAVFDPRWLDPNLDNSKLSEMAKFTSYCRLILLDDATYDYLKDKVD